MRQKILLAIIFFAYTWVVSGQSNAQWTTYLEEHEIEDIADAGDLLWLTDGREVIKFDKNTGNSIDYGFDDIEMPPDFAITSIACTKNGLPWVGVDYTGVLKMNEEDEHWIVLPPIPEFEFDMVGDILITDNDTVWTWMRKPITTILEMETILVRYQGNTVDTFTVDIVISSLAEDNDGNIWIGELNWTSSILTLVKYNDENWTTFNCPEFGYAPRVIGEIAFDELGNVWIVGTYGIMGSYSILLKFNGSKWQVYNLPVEHSLIYSLALQDDSIIWLGTRDGLMKFSNSQWTVFDTDNSGLPSNNVKSVVVDNDGIKWIGTGNGLVAFNENGLTTSTDIYSNVRKEIKLFPNPSNDFITLKIPNEFQNSTLEILNMQGKVMKSFSLSNDQNRLDVSQFHAGVYLVRIQWDENQSVKKFVKQ